jgi:hypothetical protein
MKSLRLKDGKERSLLRRHPWIFDSAIAKGGGDAGETVRGWNRTRESSWPGPLQSGLEDPRPRLELRS